MRVNVLIARGVSSVKFLDSFYESNVLASFSFSSQSLALAGSVRMAEKVSTLIISQPKNWNDDWAPSGLSVKEFMSREFPAFKFMVTGLNPLQMDDRFGLIPIMGTAGDENSNSGFLDPLPAETMEEMYDALARYGSRPSVN